MKASEFRTSLKNRPKYNNNKVNGYDSAKESIRASELKLMQNQGIISDLKEQVHFKLIPTQRDTKGNLIEKICSYVADFTYMKEEKLVVEDTKGMRLPAYIIKRKLMLAVHGIRILET